MYYSQRFTITNFTTLVSLVSLRCGPCARHIYPSLVLVQPRKTRPCLTEKLLMGLKESNQTNKITTLVNCSLFNVSNTTFQLNVQTSYCNCQRFTKTCSINFITQIQMSCTSMIWWGTQPNHEFINRRSKLPPSS